MTASATSGPGPSGAGQAPLTRVPVGVTGVLAGPRDRTAGHGRARRLCQLGLRPGASVTVLRRTVGGGRLLGVGDSRVAVDGATAAALDLVTLTAEGTRP